MTKPTKAQLAACVLVAGLGVGACRPIRGTPTPRPGALIGSVVVVVTNPYTHGRTETGLAQATLELLDSATAGAANPTVFRTTTDATGHYEFSKVPAGSYSLRAIIWSARPDDPLYFKCSHELGGGILNDGAVWVYRGEKTATFRIEPNEHEPRRTEITFSSECARNYSP